MANPHVVHEVDAHLAYKLLGITYIPHYLDPNTYVGPGNVYMSKHHLELFGAERITMMLWPRRHARL